MILRNLLCERPKAFISLFVFQTMSYTDVVAEKPKCFAEIICNSSHVYVSTTDQLDSILRIVSLKRCDFSQQCLFAAMNLEREML